MKIVSKTFVGKKPVYDLSVKDKEQYVFANGVVTHNTGIMYSANTVLFVTKAQEKDGTELAGFKFTLIAEKSRAVKEKSKFPLLVTFDRGINRYSGLLDLALALEFCVKPKNGWYSRILNGEQETKNWRAKDTDCDEFWDPILSDPNFELACNKRFKLSRGDINASNLEDLDEDLDYDSIEIDE